MTDQLSSDRLKQDLLEVLQRGNTKVEKIQVQEEPGGVRVAYVKISYNSAIADPVDAFVEAGEFLTASISSMMLGEAHRKMHGQISGPVVAKATPDPKYDWEPVITAAEANEFLRSLPPVPLYGEK